MRWSAKLWVALSGGLIAGCGVSLAAASAGRWSPMAFAAPFAAAFALLAALPAVWAPAIALRDRLILGGVLLTAATLYWPPSEYVLGGWDPGVYVSTAAVASRTGRVNFVDPLLAGLSPDERSVFVHRELREFYPGFRLLDYPDGSTVAPQFFHLFPTLMAFAFRLGGARAALSVNPLLALWTLVSLYVAARRVAGRSLAVFAPVLLLLNPLQTWMARFPTAEILAQWGIVTGMACLALAWEGNAAPAEVPSRGARMALAVLSAGAFGVALLAHYSSIIVLVALAGAGAFALAWGRPRGAERAVRTVWLAGLLVVCGGAFAYARTVVLLYAPLRDIVGPLIRTAPPSALAGALGIYFLRGRVERGWERVRWTVCLAAAAVLGVAVLWVTLARPRENTLNVYAVLSPPVFAAAVAGVWTSLLGPQRMTRWLVAALTVGMAAVLSRNMFVEPFFMWAGRRLVPVLLPGALLLALTGAQGLARLAQRLGDRVGRRCPAHFAESVALAVALVSAAMGREARSALYAYRDFAGIRSFISSVARDLPDGELFVTEQRGVAEALHFLHEVPAVFVRNKTPEIEERLRAVVRDRVHNGHRVWILTAVPEAYERWPELRFARRARYRWQGQRLQHTRRPFPTQPTPRGLDLVLLEPRAQERPDG